MVEIKMRNCLLSEIFTSCSHDFLNAGTFQCFKVTCNARIALSFKMCIIEETHLDNVLISFCLHACKVSS